MTASDPGQAEPAGTGGPSRATPADLAASSDLGRPSDAGGPADLGASGASGDPGVPADLDPARAAEAVPAAAGTVFGDRLDLAVRYVELLSTAGVERGLIGPRETGRLWERHLLNCAVLAEVVPEVVPEEAGPARRSGSLDLVDVGSGAGLPGIPLALVRPDLRVTLLEPMERRCRFLAEVVTELGLAGRVEVVRGRAPDIARPPSGRVFDVVVARAVAPLDRLGAVLLPVLRPGGVMLAMRGSRILEELQTARSDLDSQGWLEVDVVTCGAGLVDEPTRVLRAVRSARSTRGDGGRGRHGGDDRQARRTAQPRRAREGARDQPGRGRARST